jgi:hypothetical protein
MLKLRITNKGTYFDFTFISDESIHFLESAISILSKFGTAYFKEVKGTHSFPFT